MGTDLHFERFFNIFLAWDPSPTCVYVVVISSGNVGAYSDRLIGNGRWQRRERRKYCVSVVEGGGGGVEVVGCGTTNRLRRNTKVLVLIFLYFYFFNETRGQVDGFSFAVLPSYFIRSIFRKNVKTRVEWYSCISHAVHACFTRMSFVAVGGFG